MIPFWLQLNAIDMIELMPVMMGVFVVTLTTATRFGAHT